MSHDLLSCYYWHYSLPYQFIRKLKWRPWIPKKKWSSNFEDNILIGLLIFFVKFPTWSRQNMSVIIERHPAWSVWPEVSNCDEHSQRSFGKIARRWYHWSRSGRPLQRYGVSGRVLWLSPGPSRKPLRTVCCHERRKIWDPGADNVHHRQVVHPQSRLHHAVTS